MQIFHQRAESLIEQWQVLAQRSEVVAMMVPTTERKRDTPGARFDQPARNEKLLHQFRAAIITVFGIAFAITFDDTLVFLLQIERFKKFARGQHPEGLFVEGIESLHQSARIHIAAKIVKSAQQRLAV